MSTTPPPPASPTPPASGAAGTPGAKQTLSLTSFITGLGAFVLIWLPILSIIGFIAAVVAIITGFMARRREPGAPKWMALVGLIAGIVALVLGIISIIIGAVIAASFQTANLG